MPAAEDDFFPQVAVLWMQAGHDKFGMPILAPPVEIPVQWTLKAAVQYTPQGTPEGVSGSARVDRRIKLGSELWLGALSDWYGSGSSDPESGVVVVSGYSEQLDLKGHGVMSRSVTFAFKGSNA